MVGATAEDQQSNAVEETRRQQYPTYCCLGLVAAPSLIAAQASVGWAERGVVTGANMFARSIGSAVGVAVFGAVANAVLDASGGPTNPDAVIDAGAAVFIAVLVATLLTIVSAVAMPKIRADDAELSQPEPAADSR